MNRYGTTETISLKEQLCDILNTTGKVYSSKGDYKSALNFHEESLSILKAALFGKDYTCSSTGSMQDSTNEIFHPGIVKSLICIGTVHAHCGRLTEAMATLKNGLDIQLKLIGPHHVDIAATLNAIGSVYEKSGRHEKAMQCYKKARQIYLREIGESHVDVAVTMNNIAQIYHHVGKYQKAMETYREALRVMINILGDSHRNVAAIMFNMGLVHFKC
jgi:tetratricopeptide (TPR) repeat protein